MGLERRQQVYPLEWRAVSPSCSWVLGEGVDKAGAWRQKFARVEARWTIACAVNPHACLLRAQANGCPAIAPF
eukprot:scaffold171563_cov31-Tisochrysis_lutea.AAC.1